jgi:hypothetical protein
VPMHHTDKRNRKFADSLLEGGVTSELVSGIRRKASFWHFIPALRARARAAASIPPLKAGLTPANSFPK